MLRKCAFLTLEDRSDFRIYDHLLVEPLNRLGWSVKEVPWSHNHIDWRQFDAVIIRSTWDYHNVPELFVRALQTIESVTPLFNPLDICRWNLNKRYLQDLQAKGVPIVPTLWWDNLNEESTGPAFETFATDRLVVKPLIGANADDTFVLKSDDPEGWNGAIRVFENREVMIQPFIDSIPAVGEYSLLYFGGQYSHAILKRPADGDFRVQEEHGGIIRPVSPPDDLLRVGGEAIQAIDRVLLYARVDLVTLESGQPALIELELIEPSLYFEQCPNSPGMFADQFARMTSA